MNNTSLFKSGTIITILAALVGAMIFGKTGFIAAGIITHIITALIADKMSGKFNSRITSTAYNSGQAINTEMTSSHYEKLEDSESNDHKRKIMERAAEKLREYNRKNNISTQSV